MDIRTRNFSFDDLPAAVELFNRSQEADGSQGRMTLEEADKMWRAPFLDLENNCFVALNPQDQLVGLCFGIPTSVPYKGQGAGAVLPEYRRCGIGATLLRMADEHFYKTALEQSEPDKPIYIQRGADDFQSASIALFEANGYEQTRQFYEMRIEFVKAQNEPAFPDGIELRPFDVERDGHAVYQAQQEAFRDHWGHVEDIPYDRWEMSLLKSPKFDASLWFVAWDGDQVAGMSICNRWGDDQPDLGWVNILGVRRPWRKRGVAMSLLQHSFAIFQQRGFGAVGLGVDASSKTNAVALYERAGMHVHERGLSFRKILRGNAADIED